MKRLSPAIKQAIVRALAHYETPGQVAKFIKAEYGIDVSPQQAEAYHPGRRAGAGLSAELRQLFLAEREKAKSCIDAIPVAHQAVRLRHLNAVVEKAMERGNFKMALSALEQAAKEVGGAYGSTRKVELSGVNGEPVEVQHKGTVDIQALVREALGCLAEDNEPEGLPN